MKTIVITVIYVFLQLSCVIANAQLQFTNNGNFKIHNGAAITFYGDLINNGSAVDSGLVTTLKGTALQQIGGAALTTFKNLTLDNTAGSYLSTNAAISRELDIVAGTFSTTGYDFTLLSDANGTARIAPIQGNFAGNITMQRYLGAGPNGWRFLASPVSGITINDWQDDFVTSGFPGSTYPSFPFVSIYTYDETVGGTSDLGYNSPTNSTDPIVPGVGYWCYVGPTPITVDVTGPPAKFNQTFSVSFSPSAGASEDGFVMIGNPYPSPIDWDSPNWTKNNINNAVYIWNPTLQQYASWVSGVGTNGGSNVITSSQSFWIQTNAASPSLACTEYIKVSSNQAFLKPAASQGSPNASAPTIMTLKLNLVGNNYSDETVLQFGNGGTNGYDPSIDARKLFSDNASVPGIASQDSTLKDMSINNLPAINALTKIPIKTKVGVSGVYTIIIDSTFSISPNFCLVLEDLVTGIKTSVVNSASYSFYIEDTTSTARFVLYVSPSHQTKVINASCNNYYNGKIIAQGNGLGPWDYLWYSSNNSIIKQTYNSNSTDSIQNLNPGTYSVQVTDVSGMCGSLKTEALILQTNIVYAGFALSKDTIHAGVEETVIFQNYSVGATEYQWSFGDGSVKENAHLPNQHLYNSAGNYQVTLIAKENNCSDTLNKLLVVLPHNLTGITQSNLQNKITLFPNPNNGRFYVNTGNETVESSVLEIYSGTGALVYYEELNAVIKEIQLENQAKGVYLYKLTFPNNKTTQGKLIIE